MAREVALAVGLFVGALALPVGAAPYSPVSAGAVSPHTAAPASDPADLCVTPQVARALLGPGRRAVRAGRFQLRGPAYALSCGGAAWINRHTQAYLEGDIVLTTGQGRASIFCNQALFDRAAGTIQLQGNVRVTAYRAGAPQPVVSTGDSGTVSLGPAQAPPQIALHTDPPEEQYHRTRRA